MLTRDARAARTHFRKKRPERFDGRGAAGPILIQSENGIYRVLFVKLKVELQARWYLRAKVFEAFDHAGRRLNGNRFPVLVCAARLHSPSNFDRRTTNHALPLTGASFFAPANNPVSQGNSIDLEGVAHGFERERSGSPVVEDPEPSFPELLPSTSIVRFEIVLKTSHRIDQDAGHQAFDRLNGRRASPSGVKLHGHNGIRPKRKILAGRTRRIDSRSWVVHDSPAFRGCRARKKPTRQKLFIRGGGQKAVLRPCGRFFSAQFQVASPPPAQA